MRQLVTLFTFLSIVYGSYAQLDKAYFKRLNSETIPSSDLVTWRQVGPGMSGYCEEFWCHPTDENVIMMSPDMFNTYGSWDGGKSWSSVKNPDGDGKDLARVRKFEFSRQNGDFGLAITGAGGKVYETHDKGHTWKEICNLKGRYSELTVDPNNDKVWYAGPGDFWNVKANKRHINGQTRSFKNSGILKSYDGGKTWERINIGNYTDLDVGRIIVNPNNSKIVIAATNKGVFRSNDSGKTWLSSAKGLPVNRPRDIDVYYDKTSKEFIIFLLEQSTYETKGKSIVSKGGIFKSYDSGKTWEDVTGNLGVNLNKISSKLLKNRYWKAMGFWFQTDEKQLKTKHPEYSENVLDVWHRIQVNPLNKNEIYLSHNTKHDRAFLTGDVWKSNDGGETWLATARTGKYWINNTDKAYWKSRNNPLGANTFFAHLQPEMDRREDAWGNRFLEISANGNVYICLDQQVLESKNGGETWQQIDDNETAKNSNHWVGRGGSNLPGRYMLLETGIKDRYLLGSGEHGLWQTAPLGNYPDKMAVAVEQLEGQKYHHGAHSTGPMAVHPKDPNKIYFLPYRQSHRGELRRSTDGGKTWENISTIFAANTSLHERLVFMNSLIFDPVNTKNMYFCATKQPLSQVAGPYAKQLTKGDYGFYRSFDEGYTWELSNTGFNKNASVRRVILDPDNPETLYAAVNDTNGGLYKSTDKGSNWKKEKTPAEIKYVNNIFIDRNNKYMYLSSGNEQGTDTGSGVWRSKNKGKSWEKIFDLPFVWQCETSPINPDIIMISAALPPKTKIKNAKLNPGIYISMDGAKSWHKVNMGLGQHDRIVDIKPDPFREDVFWASQKGSGWAIGYLKNTTKGWSTN